MAHTTAHAKRNHLVWIGATVSVVFLISYFTFFARFPGLRDTAWINLLGVILGLGLSVWAVVRRRSLWSLAGVALSALSCAALVGYVFFLSNQLPASETAIAVGDVAPAFELTDQNGNTVQLADFQGSQLLLVFYRGFW